MAAHFLRTGSLGLVALALAAPLLLFIRRRWAADAARVLLLLAAFEWLRTLYETAGLRLALGQPWLRLAAILGGVAALALFAAYALGGRGRSLYAAAPRAPAASTAALLLTLALLVPVQIFVDPPMLLLERFLPGGGWLEILGLAAYAAFVAEKLHRPQQVGRTRRRLWTLFSVVFFAQFLIGLAGVERFLMTGALHIPVPALIVAGPIFRGGGLFMLGLFVATLLLVGPAWCSYLCYVGAWDNVAAARRPRPGTLPAWAKQARLFVAAGVIALAWLLRAVGAPMAYAAGLAVIFGLAGVAVMIAWSRRRGWMVHCTVFCPTGLVAVWLGKLSPFRLRIDAGCDRCGACSLACRYGALGPEDLARRRPGLSCTLCGDCLGRCPRRSLFYRLPWGRPATARTAFVALVTALHAVFLGVARL